MTAGAGSAQAARPIRLAVNTLGMAGTLRQGTELGSLGSERLAGSLWMFLKASRSQGALRSALTPAAPYPQPT